MSTEEVMTLILQRPWKAIAGDAKCAGPELNFFMTWKQEIEATASESAGYHWLTYSKVLNVLEGYLGDWSLECLANTAVSNKAMHDERITSCVDAP